MYVNPDEDFNAFMTFGRVISMYSSMISQSMKELMLSLK